MGRKKLKKDRKVLVQGKQGNSWKDLEKENDIKKKKFISFPVILRR